MNLHISVSYGPFPLVIARFCKLRSVSVSYTEMGVVRKCRFIIKRGADSEMQVLRKYRFMISGVQIQKCRGSKKTGS